ncbi:DNA-binding MarR family transcriptional regulator [Kibdelosporangium banguiense]|uniref:DNA-binding MarR family transcriptional regulator n=1 Tax=Kibdelosporangium banguiense TaxID=1365924 RepID=A0ABS4U239_9PSEU|nr:MarR family winged helix-turn-helix transcriptional regulator [Kibdelosporangium banguiense]MBP2330281.1 DNA-binding MarR family transcriptional regulator [Kibdelosporangium banguiense]
MTDGGPALFRLVRFFSRRWATQASAELTGEMRHVQHILVVEAVGAMRGEATVNAVAHQLGLDHSGASRMVIAAASAGYLTREESEMDRRRTVVRLTDQGSQLLAGARRWQERAFDELTASWDEQDKAQFTGYLKRIAGELGA